MSVRFSTPQGPFHLKQLAEHVGATLNRPGDSILVTDLAPLSTATEAHISMLHQKKYIKDLTSSFARACILAPQYVEYAPQDMHLLIHDNPYKAFALIAQLFYPEDKPNEAWISPTAYIAPTARLGKNCFIEHGAYIGEDAQLGDHCSIGVNTYIGDGVLMGNDCCIKNNVSIRHAHIGHNAVVYPGACIGQDGFGFASDAQGHYKIPHLGGVLIGNNVEVGANTCIDRGSLNNTVIEDWCRLDNLVQIGHNVTLGAGSILCGQVGIAGSAKIGKQVTLGGKVSVSSHVSIGDHAVILFGSSVLQDVAPNARFGGYPAMPDREWHKQNWLLKRQLKR